MALINQAAKELHVKIVYYGPAKSGKTTNLEQIHAHIQTARPDGKSKMVSLATSADRTLFFDFFPLEAQVIKGYTTKFQLFTVPGQVIYNTTRQLVLRGVDGIVFVADSNYDKMQENVESFQNLEENLRSLGLNLADIPYVLQYNKRDVPGALMQASVLALSSQYEGFAMVLLEAMSCGLPVVASDCRSGPAEIVTHGEDGFLVAPGDIEGMAAALDRLLSDPSLRDAMGAAAHRNVARFSEQAVMARWQALFEGLLRA